MLIIILITYLGLSFYGEDMYLCICSLGVYLYAHVHVCVGMYGV